MTPKVPGYKHAPSGGRDALQHTVRIDAFRPTDPQAIILRTALSQHAQGIDVHGVLGAAWQLNVVERPSQ